MRLFDLKSYAAAPILLTLCLVGGVPKAQAAGLVLDVNPGGFQVPCGTCGNSTGSTVGWGFDVTSSFTVDGIGVWDTGSDGIGTTVPTGLWTNTGTLLASASISDSSTPVASASSTGRWLFENIPQLTLTPGQYLIGTIAFNSVPTANIGDITNIPEITNIVARIGSFPDGGFQAPTNEFAVPIYGPTLRQYTPAAVPEPSSILAIGAALGFGKVFKRKFKPSKAN